MEKKTYIIYPKGFAAIIISAVGHSISKDNQSVSFQDVNATVAIFNMSEIVGFVQADHMGG